jgi:hypothetical protein
MGARWREGGLQAVVLLRTGAGIHSLGRGALGK